MSAPVETIQIKRDEAGLRLDRWFKLHFPEVGYGYLQKLLRSGQVRVDSKRVQANVRLEAGQQVRVPQVAAVAGEGSLVGAVARSGEADRALHRRRRSCSRTSMCWC